MTTQQIFQNLNQYISINTGITPVAYVGDEATTKCVYDLADEEYIRDVAGNIMFIDILVDYKLYSDTNAEKEANKQMLVNLLTFANLPNMRISIQNVAADYYNNKYVAILNISVRHYI